MNPLSPIQVVVFDLGKVLLEFDYGVAARRLSPHCRIEASQLRTHLDQSPLLLRYEAGGMNRTEFFDAIRDATGFSGVLADFLPLFGDIFTPIEPMIDLNTRFRDAGLRTFIFSNTNDIAIEHIRRTYPFFSDFSGYVYSYEHRAMKPDPAIYEIVEKITGCKGNEILYIDDRAENIATASARNWTALHHSSPEQTLRHINSFNLFPGPQ